MRRAHYIRPEPRRLITFAGVWSKWHAKPPEPPRVVESYSILTVPAGPDLVRPVHDRMPLVLPAEHRAAWLDRSLEDPTAVEADRRGERARRLGAVAGVDARQQARARRPACLDPPSADEPRKNKK